MPAVAYVNGRYMPLSRAVLSVEDRGLQFGDSLYEVVAVFNGTLFDWPQHLDRLASGIAALRLPDAPAPAVLTALATRLIANGRFTDGLIYIQFTRGTARRDHGFPAGVRPNLVMTARPFDFRQRLAQQKSGVAAISVPDERWANCHLKTTNLLPAVIAKQQARAAGAFEALFLGPDDMVREGGSTNIHLVDEDGVLVTHPVDRHILPGIMRRTLLAAARSDGMRIVERPFTRSEALAGPELMLSSTTAPCLPITRLDGAPIGSGAPGPVAGRLAALLWAEIGRQTGWRP